MLTEGCQELPSHGDEVVKSEQAENQLTNLSDSEMFQVFPSGLGLEEDDEGDLDPAPVSLPSEDENSELKIN